MWFRLLATLIYVSTVAAGQNPPGPGEPAPIYADGVFTEPRGSQSTYTLGSTMNISWQTAYETSNLWLIVDWRYSTPIQLASNIGQTWYQWEVATDSKNSSDIYAFRIVNASGTAAQQSDGGFMSAAFWIDGLPTTTIPPSSAASHISTSASAPATTSAATAVSSAATSQTTGIASNVQSPGLTKSAKIGVGVGVGVGGVGFISLIAGILLYRRSQDRKLQATDNMEPYSQVVPPAHFNAPEALYYHDYYKPPVEMQGTGRIVELDAWEVSNTPRYPVELPG
ncbi:uncharacterized protein F4807DRAFT_408097 [Annulohypoxylon truncatum]|uniref:uncharacterized protein n=1 Tax=Annulohypoxylon truncatum TaxID=327061 RepID=UPI00200831C3|nr:uncharacterized protein F4807DRAFT_408097 [Annulohypoxylon truncatum]KAI1214435.1 hypothetical protein F4807DRAFT_408097 [Annulohypoxylon truncatum]